LEHNEIKAEPIMLFIEENADVKFDLPQFPHLSEKEFERYEAGGRIEDL
jgi:hypothetical protein